MAIGAQSSLEYIIRVVFDKGGAMTAEKSITNLANKNTVAMKKINNSNKETGRSYDVFTRTVKGTQTPMMRLNQSFVDGSGKVTESSRAYKLAGNNFRNVRKESKLTTTSIGKQTSGMGALAAGYAKLALRAVAVIPVWMAIRGVWAGMTKLVGDSLRTWNDLNKEMGRVATVTRGTSEDIANLRSEILLFSAGASRGFKEAASVMYALGSAGLNVGEQLAGMQHIMNVTIGTFGNAEQVAKLVSGAYNVFGDSIEGAITSSQKFQHISDMLAYTYSKQQVELSEIANAMSYVSSIGSLLNISFDTLVTTIGVLNTGMLKGSKSGTALMNAFVKLAVSGDKLANLGVIFDSNEPLDFLDVMTQLNEIYGGQTLSLQNLKEIMDVFGRRGGRAAAQLIKDFERWKTSIDDSKAQFKDFAEYMKDTAEQTLPASWAKLWNSIKANIVGSLGEMKGLVDYVTEASEKIERGKMLRDYKDYVGGLSTKQKIVGLLPQAVQTIIPGWNAGEKVKEAFIGKELDAKQKLILSNKTLYDLDKKAAAEVKKRAKDKEKLVTIDEVLADLAKENITDEVELTARLSSIADEVLGKEGDKVKQRTRLIELLKDEVKIAELLKVEAATLNRANKRKFEDIKNAAVYERMAILGIKEQVIGRTKLAEMVSRINEDIEAANNKEQKRAAKATTEEEKKLKFKLDSLEINKLLANDNDAEIAAFLKIGGSTKEILAIEKQRLDVQNEMTKAVQKYSNTLESSFSGIFKDALLGKEQLSGVFQKMGDSIRDILAGAMADSFSKALIGSGLGEAFGNMGLGLENLFQTPAEQMEGAIKGAIDEKAPELKEQVKSGIIEGATVAKELITQGMIEAFTRGEEIRIPFSDGPPGGGGVADFNVAFKDTLTDLFSKQETSIIGQPVAPMSLSVSPAMEDFSNALLDSGTEMGQKGAQELVKGARDSSEIAQKDGTKLINGISSVFSQLLSSGSAGDSSALRGIAGVTGVFRTATSAFSSAKAGYGQTGGQIGPPTQAQSKGQAWSQAGTAAAGVTLGALSGYSAYQAMVGGGVNKAYAGTAGGLLAGGALVAAIPGGVTQLVGGLMMVAGALMQVFAEPEAAESAKSVESRTQTNQVTSRIDVSNKQLELVNRNLLALKDELTYIMQSSYYFREKTVEDRFAIDSQRGNL